MTQSCLQFSLKSLKVQNGWIPLRSPLLSSLQMDLFHVKERRAYLNTRKKALGGKASTDLYVHSKLHMLCRHGAMCTKDQCKSKTNSCNLTKHPLSGQQVNTHITWLCFERTGTSKVRSKSKSD